MTNYGQQELRRIGKNLRRQDRWERLTSHWALRLIGLILAGLAAGALLVAILGTPDAFPSAIPFH